MIKINITNVIRISFNLFLINLKRIISIGHNYKLYLFVFDEETRQTDGKLMTN